MKKFFRHSLFIASATFPSAFVHVLYILQSSAQAHCFHREGSSKGWVFHIYINTYIYIAYIYVIYRTLSLESFFGTLLHWLILVSCRFAFMPGFPIFNIMICKSTDFNFSIMPCIKPVNMDLTDSFFCLTNFY